MRTRRPKAALILRSAQREELEALAHRRSTAQAMALRARIILACAEGGHNTQVAERLGVIPQTVGRWRTRFIQSVWMAFSTNPGPVRRARSRMPLCVDEKR
jgi:hypothetical protein